MEKKGVMAELWATPTEVILIDFLECQTDTEKKHGTVPFLLDLYGPS